MFTTMEYNAILIHAKSSKWSDCICNTKNGLLLTITMIFWALYSFISTNKRTIKHIRTIIEVASQVVNYFETIMQFEFARTIHEYAILKTMNGCTWIIGSKAEQFLRHWAVGFVVWLICCLPFMHRMITFNYCFCARIWKYNVQGYSICAMYFLIELK